MILIEVSQGGDPIRFSFNEKYLEDAMKFAGDCIETGDEGTYVSITITKGDK